MIGKNAQISYHGNLTINNPRQSMMIMDIYEQSLFEKVLKFIFWWKSFSEEQKKENK